MNRRDFLKTSGALGAASLSGLGVQACASKQNSKLKFSRYRGFNILAKFIGRGPRRKFKEEDFEIMTEHGFNFARIPMSYWNWSTADSWYNIDEDVMKDIDEVVEFGRQYKIHINLNFHRLPGYCINSRHLEPVDLFDDTPENMKKALDAETETSNFYKKMVEELPAEGQQMFSRFLEIEEGHVAIVQAEINALSGVGYWFDFTDISLEMA